MSTFLLIKYQTSNINVLVWMFETYLLYVLIKGLQLFDRFL